MVRDGPECVSPVLKILCGFKNPASIESSRNTMYIQFRSSSLLQMRGFKAAYRQVSSPSNISVATPRCGEDIFADFGVFTSPNYPKKYPASVECVWRITASKGQTIILTFEDLYVST
ncbi:hypothetical protein P879_05691 [Paragonimus westermani]|uniref:CUB domain-containing protein n=1 Tax=Paragonimus westermani TaxID=34504 RepID=A0A8T0DW77_9TREM|nr:hypothetical protein P879_05691 [Paragonimus westermani]